jgi:hypothetical protein
MNRAPFQWIGIDVCKRWLDVYVRGSHDSFRVSTASTPLNVYWVNYLMIPTARINPDKNSRVCLTRYLCRATVKHN